MKCNNILDNLLKVMPRELAMSWDNVGLLAGSKEKEVKNIVVCLDLSEKLIERAISLKADLIVSHHPLIFSPIKNVTDEDVILDDLPATLQRVNGKWKVINPVVTEDGIELK